MADVIAIKEGADLDLVCPILVSQEDMIISWTCDDEPANIRSSRIHITDSGKLRIKSAKVGDSCNYRCEAADGFGTISVIIKVIIVDKRLMELLSRQNQTNQLATKQHQQEYNSQSTQLASNDNDHISNTQTNSEQSLTKTSPQHSKLDFEVAIEPSQIEVKKNRTFSLECRIKHAQNLKVPQIIWLKEFIGKKPDSLSDAHERNLVVIEDVYYHSLNWPRSITYTKKSASANSALLVRQANFVHSGRYICFAGHPPYILSSNYTSSTTESPSITEQSSSPSNNDDNQPKRMKYRWAQAIVKVDDPEGAENHRLSLESENLTSGGWKQGSNQRNLLLSVFTTNSWARNLTASLLILSALLYAAKLIYFKYTKEALGRKGANRQMDEAGNSMFIETNNSISPEVNSLAIKQVISGSFDNVSDRNSNHFYSEIGDIANKRTNTPDDPIYKVPNINSSI